MPARRMGSRGDPHIRFPPFSPLFGILILMLKAVLAFRSRSDAALSGR